MGKKLKLVALPLLALAAGCSNPVSPDQYVPLTGTVCVVVSGIDTTGATIRIQGATVNITPRAMPGEVNPGVNLVTDGNGETTPWTYDKFAGLVRMDGTFDPTKSVDIWVTLSGWSENRLQYTFASDTLRADPKIAQQP